MQPTIDRWSARDEEDARQGVVGRTKTEDTLAEEGTSGQNTGRKFSGLGSRAGEGQVLGHGCQLPEDDPEATGPTSLPRPLASVSTSSDTLAEKRHRMTQLRCLEATEDCG